MDRFVCFFIVDFLALSTLRKDWKYTFRPAYSAGTGGVRHEIRPIRMRYLWSDFGS